MPSLQEVEQFKNVLNELGDEPEILAERDEEIEDIPPPGQEVDLSDLLGDQDLSDLDVLEGLEPPEGEAQAPSAEEPEVPPEAPEVPPEFAEALPEAGPAEVLEPRPAEAPGVPQEAEAAAGEFSLEDFEFELPEEVPPAAPAEAPELGAEEAPEPAVEAPGAEEPEAPVEMDLGELFPGEAPGTGEEVEVPGLETAEEPSPAAAEPAAPEDEFAIPEGLFETEAAEGAAEAEEAAEQPAEEVPFEFELPGEAAPAAEEEVSGEELPEMPGFDLEDFDAETFTAPEGEEEAGEEVFDISDFEMPGEAAVEAAAAEPVAPEAPPAPEIPPAPEEIPEEQAAAPAPEAPGEAEFELPEEFTLPEEGFAEEAAGEGPAEEFAPEAETPAGPSEEEAEFLKVLEEQILPEGEPSAGPGAEQPGEAPPVGEAFEEFAEMPLEQVPEAAAEAEGPAAAAPEGAMEVPGAEAIPEEVSLEEEGAFPEGEHIDLEAPPEVTGEVEQYDLDEFSLEGLGEAFGVEEEARPPSAPEKEMPAEIPVVEEQFPEEITVPGAGEITFTDQQFAAIKRTLSRLPRNLKIAIEELIAEKGLEGEELRSLLALLIDGAAPTAIAEQVSRLTGRRIVLPKVFERMTGVAFEERRRTFAYAFRENILPILRVVLLSLFVLGVLTFLGYRYVYRPLYANYLYRQGYGQIDKERYQMANDGFDKATSVWVFKSWFFRYAQGFTDRQQFQMAAEKYEQLLRRFPRDREGNLAYASLLTFHLAGYEKADKLLREVLAGNMKDYEALLAQGDNYLEWAQEDESRYAEARFAYASIIDYYGEKDEVLMRMLRYFIRTDKLGETRTLKAYLDEKRSIRVDSQLYASVYAELAGYWIDKGSYDSVPDMLFTAMDRMMNQPNIHYQLARYYRYVQDPIEEETALKAAITLLERMQPLDKKHLFMLIDSYNRRGETFWRTEEYLEAEEYFRKAIARIEDAQSRRIFGQQEEFGLAYKNYGDLYYYVSRDLEPALDLYLKALNNRYETPDLNYKIGYIHYAADRYEDALLAFSKVVDQRPSNVNALYGLANSLYQRGYYSAAQGYYLRLLNLLEGREERIPYLQIYENPEHSALVEYIMKVYNNLGVTLKQLADRSLDPEKESKALVNLTFSSERFDLLSRDPVTVERGLTKNLAYLNQGGILYPTSEFDLQIYTRLPIDLQAGRF